MDFKCISEQPEWAYSPSCSRNAGQTACTTSATICCNDKTAVKKPQEIDFKCISEQPEWAYSLGCSRKVSASICCNNSCLKTAFQCYWQQSWADRVVWTCVYKACLPVSLFLFCIILTVAIKCQHSTSIHFQYCLQQTGKRAAKALQDRHSMN